MPERALRRSTSATPSMPIVEITTSRGEVAFFQGDIFDIPCPDQFFDFVFCYGVLQHTPDADRAFRELVRTLRPGGRISIDFYPKTRKLDPFNQPKYFWRRWTVGMAPERLLRIIRAYMPWWLPVDTGDTPRSLSRTEISGCASHSLLELYQERTNQ